jgi:hypothetical protein
MDRRVEDFVKGLNQLCKDTGFDIFSHDFSEPILSSFEGNTYVLLMNGNSEDEKYSACKSK